MLGVVARFHVTSLPIELQHDNGVGVALVERLRKEPYGALHATVVEAMTTNETSFFRDVHPYETLRKHVLPELIARRRIERSLHIWSAACSTGQEPYSLAMLIKDTPELAGWSVRITASDLSRGAMTKAQSGSYTSLELGRGLPARMLAQYFDRDGALFRVKPDIKSVGDLFAWLSAKGADLLVSDSKTVIGRLPTWYRENINAPTFLLLPLMVKGKPIGLIYADKGKAGEIVLGEGDLALLRALRDQAAAAFANTG